MGFSLMPGSTRTGWDVAALALTWFTSGDRFVSNVFLNWEAENKYNVSNQHLTNLSLMRGTKKVSDSEGKKY